MIANQAQEFIGTMQVAVSCDQRQNVLGAFKDPETVRNKAFQFFIQIHEPPRLAPHDVGYTRVSTVVRPHSVYLPRTATFEVILCKL